MKVRLSIILFNFITFFKTHFRLVEFIASYSYFRHRSDGFFPENGITVSFYFSKFSERNH